MSTDPQHTDSDTAESPPDIAVGTDEPVRVVDLFCGGGGLSKAIADVVSESGRELELKALNHDEKSIATHKQNHSEYAAQFCADAGGLKPSELFGDPGQVGAPTVHLLAAGIECVGHSGARGAKKPKPQDRISAWYALNFVEKLEPERILFENVPQFVNYGDVFSNDGSDDGSMFEQFISVLNNLGYAVDWKVLTAADYGDPQLRDRLIIVGSKDGKPTFPEPTHSPNGEMPGTKPYRTAADIIDWDDPGESIFSRDMTGRQRVLSNSTMQRIAAGIKEFGSTKLKPFAEFIETLGREKDVNDPDKEACTRSIPQLRKHAVPFAAANHVARQTDKPFLVRFPGQFEQQFSLIMGQQGGAKASPTTFPLPTIATAGNIHFASSGLTPLPQPQQYPTTIVPRNLPRRDRFSNSVYRADKNPLHTITAENHDGWIMTPQTQVFSQPSSETIGHEMSAETPYLAMQYSERSSQQPRTRSIDRPLPTLPAKRIPASVCQPFLTDYHGTGTAQPIDEPLRTIECKDRFGLIAPSCPFVGFDLKYRMLKPVELARGQGFKDEYSFVGTKTERTRQIGNAIPIGLGRAVVREALSETVPTIDSFNKTATTVDNNTKDHARSQIDAEIDRLHGMMDKTPANRL